VAFARAFHRPRDRTEKGGRFRLQSGCAATRRAGQGTASPAAKDRAAATRKFFAWKRRCPARPDRAAFPECFIEQPSAAQILSKTSVKKKLSRSAWFIVKKTAERLHVRPLLN